MHFAPLQALLLCVPHPRYPLYSSVGWGLSRTVIASMLDPMLFGLHNLLSLHAYRALVWGSSSTRLLQPCFTGKQKSAACAVACVWCHVTAVHSFHLLAGHGVTLYVVDSPGARCSFTVANSGLSDHSAELYFACIWPWHFEPGRS